MNAKHIVMAAGIYLLVVGAAQYISESSTSSPTADSIANLPAFGTAAVNAVGGVALLLFGPKLISKVA